MTERIAAVFGWLCLAALGVFVAMNMQMSRVELPGVSLTAPLALIMAIAAVLGAFGAPGLKRVIGWTRPPVQRGFVDTLRAVVGWIAVAALVVFAAMNLAEAHVRLPRIELRAPMAALVALGAVAGAFGHGGLRAALRAIRRPARSRPLPGAVATAATAPIASEPAPVAAPEPSPAASIEGIGVSDVGKVRDHNEDSYLVDDDLRLYVVCDGMGGHAGGEVASNAAINAMHRVVTERRAELTTGAAAVEVLTAGARAAAIDVHARSVADTRLHGMGCTLTALLVTDGGAAMAHVGDTRLYRVRGGVANQLSSDHTMVQGLIEAGLSEEQAKAGAYAHTLTRCIGRDPEVQIDAGEIELAPGDLLVLCSDGLTEYAPSPEALAELIGDDVASVPARLVDYANQQGGQDNVTVVAVQIPTTGHRLVSSTIPPV